MTTVRRKAGMSYGEVAEYENCVDRIRRASLSIAKDTREYITNGTMVSDGDLFLSNIKGDYMVIQNCMKKINAMYKKYGNL